MELQPLLPILKPSTAPSPTHRTSPLTPYGLFAQPVAHINDHGTAIAAATPGKSKQGQKNHNPLPSTKNNNLGNDDENNSKFGVTFCHYNDKNPAPMAFAEDLFRDGIIVPLHYHLEAHGEGTGPRSPPAAFPEKEPASGAKKWMGFEPLAMVGDAAEKISKENESLEPFHWRKLECSFKESFDRIYDEKWSEWELDVCDVYGGRRSSSTYYCRLKKRGRQQSSCKGWQYLKHFSCLSPLCRVEYCLSRSI